MNLLILINDAPCGTERASHGLRLVMAPWIDKEK